MAECTHTRLMQLTPKAADRVRCQHCHLTIDAAELGSAHCPECFEATGTRRREFVPVAAEVRDVRFRCEDCGAML